jgi:hypothetical protein
MCEQRSLVVLWTTQQHTTTSNGSGIGSKAQAEILPIGRQSQGSVVARVEKFSPGEETPGTWCRWALPVTSSAQKPAPAGLGIRTRYALDSKRLHEK